MKSLKSCYSINFSRVLATLAVIAISIFTATNVRAQASSATLSGQVVDQNGAIVPGADVRVLNSQTGLQRQTTTTDQGLFLFPSLPPATYVVTASHQGFAPVEIKDIVLNVGDRKALTIPLKTGDIKETVNITGEAPLINESPAVGTVVDQKYIANMPLNGRSFQDLILLTPGVVTQSPQNSGNAVLGQTGEFSVNGQRQESNYYTVDGVSANVGATPGIFMIIQAGASGSLPAATTLGTTQALVSVDDLQEFRVQTSSYSAEYGRNPGGQFSFQTKSGTNQWHGSAYDYLRNGYFDAADWFNNYFGVKQPKVRQNDFGGTLGGPVLLPRFGEGGSQPAYNGRNRTFFFVSYEGLRVSVPQPATITFVPDLALRASAPTPLNQVLNAFPVPNGLDDTTNGIAQFIASWSNPSSIDSTSVRLDHVVNNKLTLFFRFADTRSNSTSRNSGVIVPGVPSVKQIAANTSRTYTAGATSPLTNRVSNEFRFNYSSNEVTGRSIDDPFGGAAPVDLFQLTGVSAQGQPAVNLLLGGRVIPLAFTTVSSLQRQLNVVDTIDILSGQHRLKFGVDYRRLAPVATVPGLRLTHTYLSKAAVQSNTARVLTVSTAPAYPLYTNFSAFAQDEWRVSQRVSLSMGLRWDVNPAPGVTRGLKPYTIQGSTPSAWSLAPQGTPLWQTTWFNFAPRLGLAYMLHVKPGLETVLRGGAGVFFDTAQQVGSAGFNAIGFSAQTIGSGSFPAPIVPPLIVNPPVVPYATEPIVFPAHLQLPYTIQWNASIEQELGKSQTVTLSYVGSHAGRLLTFQRVSTPTNPNSKTWSFTSNGLVSDYDALQIQFQRRLSKGLSAIGAYTWSHCIDSGSYNYSLSVQRGNCDFDVRHNFSAAFSYDLPRVSRNAFARAVLNNWGIDDRLIARTSFPIPLTGTQYFDPLTGQRQVSGLDLVPGQPIYLHGANCASILQGLGELKAGQGCPGGRAVNPTAFATVPFSGGIPSRQGTAPRNFVRGFGAWQMNFAIRRDFPIHEQLKLQFRAEAFNIFNHPNFGTITSTYCSGTGCTFGQATGMLATSLGSTLSPLYQMGGSRSMQFALKLMW